MYQIILALVFHVLDLASGFIGAVKCGTVESAKMRDGMFKKVGFIFCYIIGVILDTYGHVLGLNIGIQVLPILVAYSVTTEIVSIIENVHEINPDLVPEKLIKLFHISSDKKGD